MAAEPDLHVVTGAFGFTGRRIAQRLLEQGKRVRTLTGHPHRPDPFGGRVEAAPFRFDDPEAMAESLRGAAVLYNTYWIRFARGEATFARAVVNTEALLAAARQAGVGRVVHISITHPDLDSPRPYFEGKALVEQVVRESGLRYAILRPAVLFGEQAILINNIAWMLRRLPVFGIFGDGRYRVQPSYVDDVAALAVEMGWRQDDIVMDAVGPEIYSYNDLVRLLRRRVGSRAAIVHIPPALGLMISNVLGSAMGDVVVTRDEIEGLMANLLVSDQPPACSTRFSDWLEQHADEVGLAYQSEVGRHYR